MNDSASPATAQRQAPRGARLTVFLAILLDLIGFGMILPLLPFYAQTFHASRVTIGVIFASYSMAQLLFAPWLGRLSDRFGRRPLMLASIAGGAAAHLLFATAGSIAMLLVARSLSGIAAANYGIAQAYLADVTPPAQRSRAMGLVGAAFGLGFVIGPGLGVWLTRYGIAAVPYSAAALSAANLLIALVALPESLPRAARGPALAKPLFGLADLRQLWRDGRLRNLMLLAFLVMFCFSIMEATLALFCQASFGFGPRATSGLFLYVGVVLVVVQGGLLGRLVKAFGDRRLIVGGIALMALGLLALPLPSQAGWLLLTTGLLAIGSGVHNPSLLALLSQLSSEGTQGETIGVSRSCGALARVVGPLAGTWIFEVAGASWPFWSAGGLMLVALLIARDLLRQVPAPESPAADGVAAIARSA
ncbi:MAG TPA: MFS transporter [Thermoanaerobaculia bacterium]|nr:MFS transporter [Thermoanaerobaculia bacterium]